MTELGGRTALKTVLGLDNVDALADKWTGDAFVRRSDTPDRVVFCLAPVVFARIVQSVSRYGLDGPGIESR